MIKIILSILLILIGAGGVRAKLLDWKEDKDHRLLNEFLEFIFIGPIFLVSLLFILVGVCWFVYLLMHF